MRSPDGNFGGLTVELAGRSRKYHPRFAMAWQGSGSIDYLSGCHALATPIQQSHCNPEQFFPSEVPVSTAVVSDIHGNATALTTVLADIATRGITRIVCLGDTVGYGPEPLQCVDLVRARCAWTLMGNHDYGVLYEPTNFNPSAEGSAFWTREQFDREPDEKLRAERYEFLNRLKVRVQDTIGENGTSIPLLAVHGSPRRPINEYIFPQDVQDAPDKLESIFDRVSRICIVGHTHVPGVFTDEPDFYPPQRTRRERVQIFRGGAGHHQRRKCWPTKGL